MESPFLLPIPFQLYYFPKTKTIYSFQSWAKSAALASRFLRRPHSGHSARKELWCCEAAMLCSRNAGSSRDFLPSQWDPSFRPGAPSNKELWKNDCSFSHSSSAETGITPYRSSDIQNRSSFPIRRHPTVPGVQSGSGWPSGRSRYQPGSRWLPVSGKHRYRPG